MDGHTHRCKSCVSRKKIIPTEGKTCTICGDFKILENFTIRKNGLLGRNSVCKICFNKKNLLYTKDNKEKIRKRNNIWAKEKRKNDSIFKLKRNMRCRISEFLKNRKMEKRNTTFNIIGCSPLELKIHIENQFVDGMSWENYNFWSWHVDHKIPLDSAKTEDEVYKLCHYTNLQPLWMKDNIEKSNKII